MQRAAVVGLLVVATSAAGLIVLEGVSSSLLFARELFRSSTLGDVAEARHTRHDPLLGWVNVPNTFLPDVYGPGVYVRINRQGFRANNDVPAHVPEGWTRGICSGDSFTFGYGVDNEHTWCRLLQHDDRRFETVNMGLGGYGLDQAYLAYQRDAEQLGHQVHLFAFITLDFQRMASTSFMGYPKPTLELENGNLVVHGVPVPRRPVYASWVARFAPALRELRMTHLAGRVAYRLGLAAGSGPTTSDDTTWAIASVIFERLRDLNKTRGSTLVLIYLPTQKDYANTSVDVWRTRVRDLGARAGVAVIDLITDFRKMPPQEMEAMFIQSSRLDYAKAAGHYTVAGNLWVARKLFERLVGMPGIIPRVQP